MTRSMGRGKVRERVELVEIAEAYLTKLAIDCEPKTVRDARTVLTRILADTGWLTIDDIHEEGIDAWRAERIAAGMSNRTINRHTIALHSALRLALRRRVISYDPLSGLESLSTKGKHRKRKARALAEVEIEDLMRAARAIDARYPNRFPRMPLLRTLIMTGCRWGELVACMWTDLDAERCTLRLRAETTKSSEERTIPLDREVLDLILTLRADFVRVVGELPRSGDRIFLSPHGKPWAKCPANFHRFLSEAMRVARIPK